MFQFRAFPSYTYLIQYMILRYCLSVFPHSEISGSRLICSSPKLIAACRVLHRLLMPRHSPCALFSLTLHSVLCLVLLNYAGLQQKMSHKIVFTLPKQTFRSAPIKSSTMLFFMSSRPFGHNALCCLAFLSPLFSFQGASRDIPSKLNNVRGQPLGFQNV